MARPRWTYRVTEVNSSLDSFETAQKFARGCVREGVALHAATLRPARADHPAVAPEYGGQIKTAWPGARSRAGLDPELTPHDLRHTWASWHYPANRDLLALKVEGGWSSVALVERYAHLLPAGHEGAIKMFWSGRDTDVTRTLVVVPLSGWLPKEKVG